jgi:tetratricopeptide (TPR) repeat protein
MWWGLILSEKPFYSYSIAAYLNLGLLLSKQQGQYDQAVHWLSACSQLDGSGVRDPQAHRHSQIQALVSWGQLELARGHPETSIQLYKQALRRWPTSVQQFQVLPVTFSPTQPFDRRQSVRRSMNGWPSSSSSNLSIHAHECRQT